MAKQNSVSEAAPQAVALVGGGKGGYAVLSMLLQMPKVRILYLCDVDPDAPAIVLAKQHGIECCNDPEFEKLADNSDIELILEITGHPNVFQTLNRIKHSETSLIGADGNRFLFDLLETQEQAKEELRAYQSTLHDRIAERSADLERAIDLLQHQLAEHEALSETLQHVNDQKTKYLLRSTHQLKAPFAAIQSYADLILEGFTGDIPTKTQDIMQKIKRRCTMLSDAIHEMLELANLKSIVVENVKKDTGKFDTVLEEVIGKVGDLAASRDISLEFSPLKAEPYSVSHNKDQIAILFSILIVNAINYSHEGASVEVSVSRKGFDIVVSVTDHGIGISEENLKRIYEEYFRSNRAAEHYPDGSGLGLAIAQEITKLHGFELRAHSAIGKGTTFEVVAPALR